MPAEPAHGELMSSHGVHVDEPAPTRRAMADSFSMSFADPPAATMATFAAPAAGADWGAMAGYVW